MISPSSALDISQSLHVLPAQTIHRINLLNIWNITPESHILELGCGQGDFTATLAHTLTSTGYITALDPAPLTYGSPTTLGEAQASLSSSPIGDRITWHQADPITYLSSLPPDQAPYDAIVLCHSLWYFSSKAEIRRTLEVAKGRAKRLLIAEWRLASNAKNAMPHILAAMTRAVCEAHVSDSDANIRCLMAPEAIKEVAVEAGWRVERENVVVPGVELQDAGWEVSMVRDEEFMRRAGEKIGDERVVDVLRGMRTGMLESVRRVEEVGGRVRCMDVWVAEFV